MADSREHDESIRIAHLTMLQGVITRMGANSFTLKALAATFGSAAVAVMATVETPSPYYAVVAIVPMIIFWLMDAQYLRLERAYRKLYDHIRKGEEVEAYSLEATPFMRDTASVLRLVVSRSVSWFYVAIFVFGRGRVFDFLRGVNGGYFRIGISPGQQTPGFLFVSLPERHLAGESGSQLVGYNHENTRVSEGFLTEAFGKIPNEQDRIHSRA